MNKKNGSSKRIFRSFTDVNNYNKLLLELDKKQSTKEPINEEIKICETNRDRTRKKEIKNYTKTIDQIYNNKIQGSMQASTNSFQPNVYDPNAYEPEIYNSNKIKEVGISILKRLNEGEEKKEKKERIEIQNRIKVNIQFEINNIGDLLKMIEEYPDDEEIEYNINMSLLHKIKRPLLDLNAMIGMQNLKENIVDQILFYIQNLHKNTNKTDKDKEIPSNDFMHTVIYGPPGTGKTEIAKIIGSIFSNLGILSKGTFKKVTRSDLVAGYLGQTALKTRDVIKESLGGVLFIDEAYALGNQEKRDTFSKECIDTLCEALSDHKDNLMVIIAGYETDLNECFFNYNQGLNSRFTWRFKIDEYSAEDLYNIFIKKIKDCGWSIDQSSVNVKWFEKNKGSFKSFGRDIETLFAKTKIAHSRRVFCLDETEKKRLTVVDVNKGLEIYLKNATDKGKKDEENMKRIISYMYS